MNDNVEANPITNDKQGKDELEKTHEFFTSTPKKNDDSSNPKDPNESKILPDCQNIHLKGWSTQFSGLRRARCFGGDIYWFQEAGDSSEQLLPGNVELN